ncbi:MAG: hypothetical protein LLG01_05875 [Planctomycetaceae bacterium]|nr:hypothetical protein [Planctomycetaceae bacterium]
MRRVLFCNTPQPLREFLACAGEGKVEYLLFTTDAAAGEIAALAREQSRMQPADSSPAACPRSSNFASAFIDFVAEVNRVNAGRYWWALNFTNKNPITTRLCDRAAQLLAIIDMLDAARTEHFIVVSDDGVLVRQLRLWADGKDIEIVSAIALPADAKALARRLGPTAALAAFARTAWRALVARMLSLRHPAPRGGHNVVLSLLTAPSLPREGGYRDTYFGPLLEHLAKQEKPLLNLLIVTDEGYWPLLKRAHAQAAHEVQTIEFFLGPMALLRCLRRSLAAYFCPPRLKAPAVLAGVDVTALVDEEIRQDVRSGRYFDNLRVYHAMIGLCDEIQIDRLIYPFENRAFEKMTVQAMREAAPAARLVGYQHASLSLRHTNFLLAPGEAGRIPLPDSVLTMGKIARDIMVGPGRFPPSLVSVGCALRQKTYDGPLKTQRPLKNLLVVLATNTQEYVKVLTMLAEAFKDARAYELWIRPHPVFPLEDALAVTGPLPLAYHKADKEPLAQCLDWADAVLYVHSTVAIEAMARGTPAVFLNIPNVLNPDPMVTFDDFKWRADSPADLPAVLAAISALSPADFARRQQAGAAFTRDYFQNVTEGSLNAFLTA